MSKNADARSDATVSSLRELQTSGATRLGQTLDRLASEIGAHADVRAVFGEAVTEQGVTVVPVARVFGAYGAGASGADANAARGGVGAAGGFYATPVGFIEIDRNGARFRSFEGPLGEWSGPAEVALRLLTRLVRSVAAAVQRRWS